MFLHYLKVSWRNLLKDKAFSAINVLGLALAIACCFLLIFWIKFERSYEKCYPGSDKIYKVLEEEKRTDGLVYSDFIRPGISKSLKETFPQIQYATVTRSETLPFTIQGKEGDGIMATLVSTDKDFLRMFAYDYIEGSPESVIQKRGAIISEETARKFFGKNSAIGETVDFGSFGMATFTIAAVVKMPENTHIRFDILNPFVNDGNYGIHYIKLADEAKPTVEFERQIADYLSANRDTKNKLKLQPIRRIHLYSPASIHDETLGNVSQIYLFSGAALLILLIAIINYVNTSIARAMSRMKEVGVRKVFGANRKKLIERFLFESFILSLVAVFISLVFVELFFPSFSQIMGHRVSLLLDIGIFVIVILMSVIVTFSVISLLLTLMGVISMLSFMIEKRSKEIAVRHINGAKTKNIILLFARDIFKIAIFTAIIAIPLCYLLLSNWIRSYVYRTRLNGWVFLLIPLLIMIATLLVISVQIYFTAQKNPVESLKNE